MTDANRPFRGYAEFYDHMYKQKNYPQECDFLEEATARFSNNKPSNILDLGCGTGGHAIILAQRGYAVHGVDFSKEMLDRAKQKSEASPAKSLLSWSEADISCFKSSKKFDQVICMFAVISYLTTNEQLKNFFKVVRDHLVPGGLFICDFWYGPAVLLDPPGEGEKELVTDKGIAKKSASAEIDYNRHVVRVDYRLSSADNNDPIVCESHFMRYLFLPELELLAESADLKFEHACKCCNLKEAPSQQTWTVSAIFKG